MGISAAVEGVTAVAKALARRVCEERVESVTTSRCGSSPVFKDGRAGAFVRSAATAEALAEATRLSVSQALSMAA